MTTQRREQRRTVLLSIVARGTISKAELTKLLGFKRSADGWLADNADLPFRETPDGRIYVVPFSARRRGEPLIRNIETHGLGGIQAVRG
jgi:hypothetical protein